MPNLSPPARELLSLITAMMDFEEALDQAGISTPQHIIDAHEPLARRNARLASS